MRVWGRSARSASIDRGQATVELALLLPVFVALIITIAHVGVVARAQLQVAHAAREGARAASVEPTVDVARQAALAGSGVDGARTEVTLDVAGRLATVTVRHRVPALPPLSFVRDAVVAEAEATMRIEDVG